MASYTVRLHCPRCGAEHTVIGEITETWELLSEAARRLVALETQQDRAAAVDHLASELARNDRLIPLERLALGDRLQEKVRIEVISLVEDGLRRRD